jgi:ATP-dependent Clp protease protease subunit
MPAASSLTPNPVYAVFCGNIDQFNGQKIVNFFSLAESDHYNEAHILFQSTGGYVGDGVFLHHFFKALPMRVTLYNSGQISSAGVTAFLGAPVRVANQFATFMLHNSTNPATMADAAKLGAIAKGLILDDQRTQAILKQSIQMPDALWAEMSTHNLFLSADDALAYGLVTRIGNFAPPKGVRVFNVTP